MSIKEKTVLGEGETEKALINVLNKAEGLFCKFIKFNAFQYEIRKIIRDIPKKSMVYIMYDSDVLDGDNNANALINKFTNNLEMLKTNGCRIYLLQQTKNFEDELCFACSKTIRELQQSFSAQSNKDFKPALIKDTNLLQKLQKLGFEKTKLWSKDIHIRIQFDNKKVFKGTFNSLR